VKLLHVTVHFEFADVIAAILDRHGTANYARYPMIEGKDADGKHYGTQVFPGNVTVIQAQVSEEKVDDLLRDLKTFKLEKQAHQHLQAVVLPIERRLED
jgi:hypothetical protein